jgi:hypothetical protein
MGAVAFVAVRFGGKSAVGSLLIRYGMIIVAIRLAKGLVPWYQQRLPGRAPQGK